MSTCPADLVAFAGRLADAAGEAIRPYFRQPIPVETKADSTPVTQADREGERAMRDLITRHYPGHGVIGEEFGESDAGADSVWVLDPIDGTTSFVTGRPWFGTLIALVHKGETVLGIIDQPVSGERWVGARGRPTTLNNRDISVRPCAGLGQASLDCTDAAMFTEAEGAAFAIIRDQAARVRYGTDCYAYGLLAAGFVDLVIEATMEYYDFAALVPVIEGAGGTITDWDGAPLGRGSDGRVVAAGDSRVHEAALAHLGPAAQE